jgi:hypothetical protein
MKTWMVALGALWLASAGAVTTTAGEPPNAPTNNNDKAKDAKPRKASVEEAAKAIGVSADELKRLRELGFVDSEIVTQLRDHKRTARQIITEREVVSDVAKAFAEVNARVYQMPEKEQAAERERSLRAALAKVRRDHRTSKEELRRILAGTSFFTPEEMNRVLGAGFFAADELRRVFFSADDEKRSAK